MVMDKAKDTMETAKDTIKVKRISLNISIFKLKEIVLSKELVLLI